MNIIINNLGNIIFLLFCVSIVRPVKSGLEIEYKKQKLMRDCTYEKANYFALKTENKFCIKNQIFFEINKFNEFLNGGLLDREIKIIDKRIEKIKIYKEEEDEFFVYVCEASQENSIFLCEGNVKRLVLGLKGDKWINFKINQEFTSEKNLSKAFTTRGLSKSKLLKDHKGAIADFSKAIELDPNNSKNYYRRGLLIYYESDDLNSAFRDLSRSIELNPKNDNPAYEVRGYVRIKSLEKYKNADYGNAIKDLDKALEFLKNDDFIYGERAYAHIMNGDNKSAFNDFSKAIEINPKSAFAYYGRGYLKYMEDDYVEAIKNFKESLKIEPNEKDVVVYLGLAKYYKGDYEDAIEDYDSALKFEPKENEIFDKVDILINRGLAKYYKGDYEEAIEDYDNALKLESNIERRIKILRHRQEANSYKGSYLKSRFDELKIQKLLKIKSRTY